MARTKQTPSRSTTLPAPKNQVAFKAPSKSIASTGAMHKSSTYALREIQKYQNVIRLRIGKITFQNLVCEIAENLQVKMKFRSLAVLALQTASEEYLVELFADANLCATHAKRVTVIPDDIHLAQMIREKHA